MTFRRRVGGGLLYYLYLYLCKKAFSRSRPGTCFIRFQFNFARVPAAVVTIILPVLLFIFLLYVQTFHPMIRTEQNLYQDKVISQQRT